MEIKAKELRENGVEVDMPVEWNRKPIRQRTIKYSKDMQRYVLSDIRTGEVDYSYTKLSDLVRNTNKIFNMDDVAVDN